VLLTFFGQSGWGLETAGERLLIDPYPISEESRQALDGYADSTLRHVLVTHGGFDHLGISFDLVARSPSARLVADIAVVRHAGKSGLPADRVDTIGWNLELVRDGWHFRGLEAKHASVLESVDGEYITGMPLGFVLWHEAEPEVRVMHLGDTSIFSDLSLFGRLYAPLVAIINVRGAMSAREAALAAFWLGAEVALPVHFTRDPSAAEEFCAAVSYQARPIRSWVPQVGASYRVERTTTISG